MQTYKSRSDHRPPEWDTESSPTTVYHNYDIQEGTDENGRYFEYMVEKLDAGECVRVLLTAVADLAHKDELKQGAILALMDMEVGL